MQFIKLNEHAVRPTQATDGSAAYDLVLVDDVILKANESPRLAPLGFKLWIQDPTLVGLIYIRSSLARRGVSLANGVGVIDSDYQDQWGLLLTTHIWREQSLKRGDRVAQLIFKKIHHPTIDEVNEFSGTSGRFGGFGSTGL